MDEIDVAIEARYRVGIMRAKVGESDESTFVKIVTDAIQRFSNAVADQLPDLALETNSFSTPHLVPSGGTYNPLDFMQIGLAEKAERGLSFLIIVTDVDLSPSKMSYTLALPSRLTNIALVTTRRLNPEFWGRETDNALAADRLSKLLIHAFGHLLNLSHSANPENVMAKIEGVEALDGMVDFTKAQVDEIEKTLPVEAFERSTRSNKFSFAVSTIFRRLSSIVKAVIRANPLRLVTRMPTMLATAISVIALLLFGAEVWDYAAMASNGQVAGLTILSFAIGTFVLFRAFSFATVSARDGRVMESSIVTSAATIITLFLTLFVMFLGFAGLMLFFAETIFPRPLMESWTTVEDARSLDDHIRLATFLAGLGVLSGSLGGSADSRNVVRRVLFMSDEI